MPVGAVAQAGAPGATKARAEGASAGVSSVLAPKKAESPAPDATPQDTGATGAASSGGVAAAAKGVRGAAAAKRKDNPVSSPKEGSPAKDAEPPSPLDLERQKLMKLLEKSSMSLTKRLGNIESNLSELEEAYITDTWPHGNVIRGWDGYIRRVDRPNKNSAGNGSGSATGAPKFRKPRATDRIFSLSSRTSAIRKEVAETQAYKKGTQSKKKKKR